MRLVSGPGELTFNRKQFISYSFRHAKPRSSSVGITMRTC